MQSIETKYIGSSNNRPVRYKATISGGKHSVTMSSDLEISDDEKQHDRVALALCKKLKWSGVLRSGHTKTGRIYVFENEWNRLEIPK